MMEVLGPLIGPVVSIGVCAIGGLVTFGALKERSTRNAQEAATANARAEAADIRAAQVGKDLADFREQVASKYASHDTVRAVEERIVDAINRLGDRLDAVIIPRSRSPRS